LNGCVYPDGEKEQILPPFDTLYLVSNLPFGHAMNLKFENFWKNSSTEPIYYRLYKLNPETYEEEEMLKDWEQESAFFDVKSWEFKEVAGATKDHQVASVAWIYSLY